MIQQFYLGTWLENKDSKVITIKGNEVEILKWDKKDENNRNNIIACISISEKEQETAIFDSLGHCISRENKEKDPGELDLYIEFNKEIGEFERELAKLIYSGHLGQKNALEKAIKAAPKLREIIKKELQPKEE